MPTSKEEAKTRVAALVAEHKTLTPAQAKAYHEAKTKQGFVVPLFRSLGWDFDNVEEVAPEEKASKGRVDYAFKLRGVSRFYLEAKPLKADLNDPDYIKQAVTYAYNKGVTWAGLTSFDRLRLFNAQTGQAFLNLTCQDYVDDFDRLWLLSKESVEAGALDKEAAKVGALRAPQPVEKLLFALLRQWREELSAQLHHYNPHLSFAQIDEIILRLFNRLIFIRNAEDRGIEERVLLAALNQWESGGHRPELIESLRGIFRRFDGYYDSDLFMPHPVDQVFIEGDTLAHIIRGLYDVPGGLASYDFSVIDADVLGAVYEQYLGHVATVVKQRAKEAQTQLSLGFPAEEISLEAKRQKRKEQGIYYTPRWVTDYIVRQTVGRFISEHNTHDDILNIKVLDPACGSGSFLIRAYDELLTYHAKVRGKPVQELDQWDRLPILTGNIFGVDLDGQAVEIARLNLLLRSLARRETLPSLENNIRQGNSLISGGEAELKPYFGDSWPEKRPFNYEQEFADIMKAGGFDVVIGNPPYVGFQGFPEPEQIRGYLRGKYVSAVGRFDIYLPFLERAIQLARSDGLVGFICPTNFMKRGHGERLRKFLLSNCQLLTVVDFEDYQVFEGALNYTGVFIFRKREASAKHQLKYFTKNLDSEVAVLNQNSLGEGPWVVLTPDTAKVVHRVKQSPHDPLSMLVESISEGIVTGKNEVFVVPLEVAKKIGLEPQILRPAIQGRQARKYVLEPVRNVLIYPYLYSEGKSEPIPENELSANLPRVYNYLLSKKKLLSGRRYFERSTKAWYELWCERSFQQQAVRKIVVAELAAENRFALADEGTFYLDTTCGIVPKEKNLLFHLYLLGLLNSSLLEFYYKRTTVPKASGFYIYKTMFLKDLPIRRIDFANPAEKKWHDDLVALVERMLALHQKLHQAPLEWFEERREVEREIERVDQAIDSLVYDLYGLTEAERQIVEAGA